MEYNVVFILVSIPFRIGNSIFYKSSHNIPWILSTFFQIEKYFMLEQSWAELSRDGQTAGWQNDYQSVLTDNNSGPDLGNISRNENWDFHAILVILADNEQTPAASFRSYICSLCDLLRHINSNKQ